MPGSSRLDPSLAADHCGPRSTCRKRARPRPPASRASTAGESVERSFISPTTGWASTPSPTDTKLRDDRRSARPGGAATVRESLDELRLGAGSRSEIPPQGHRRRSRPRYGKPTEERPKNQPGAFATPAAWLRARRRAAGDLSCRFSIVGGAARWSAGSSARAAESEKRLTRRSLWELPGAPDAAVVAVRRLIAAVQVACGDPRCVDDCVLRVPTPGATEDSGSHRAELDEVAVVTRCLAAVCDHGAANRQGLERIRKRHAAV